MLGDWHRPSPFWPDLLTLQFAMPYEMKALSCDPSRIKGMSERLIVSHYENNYGGAVKRLNLIQENLAELDYPNAPGFLITGLKREELIAMNSMILHELFFDGLGDASEPGSAVARCLSDRFRLGSAMAKGQGPGGRIRVGASVLVAPRQEAGQSVGRRSLPYLRAVFLFSRSTCTSTRITSISVPRPLVTLMSS